MQSFLTIRMPFLLVVPALAAQPQPALGLFGSQGEAAGLTNLQERLRTTYEALPVGASGLPEASAVRYLAQRFLTAEYGRWVHGLDRAPLHGSRNATEMAFRRAAELLQVPKALPLADQEALQAVQRSELGRGFTLREAAAFVHAIENVLANTDMMTMRRAHALAKQMSSGKASPKLRSVLLTYAALHMSGTEADDLYNRGLKDAKARRRLEQEIQSTMDKLRNDIAGEPLEELLLSAERAMTAPGGRRAGNRALEGMRLMRRKLDERQTFECSKFHGHLAKIDSEGSGQVEFRSTFGENMKDWALLETPEYLSVVGALQERSAKGVGPGVLIPNYVTGMNSCRDTSSWHASICCPDECELQILPKLEAAARGPRLAPKQIWQAIHQPLVGSGLHNSAAKKSLRAGLRRLGLRSTDGRIAVHGRPLGRWLHRAFPHKCRKPVTAGSPLLVDPGLSPTSWERAGKHLPIDPPEVAEVRKHLKRRWGKDGTGQDITSFAARSYLGLDAEIQLIRKFHEVRKAGGPPVKQQLEDFLNVRVMKDKPDHVLHLSAAFAAAGLLGLSVLALVLAARCTPLVSALSSATAVACASTACFAACVAGIWASCKQLAGKAAGISSSFGRAAAASAACAERAEAAAGCVLSAPKACARRASGGLAGASAAVGEWLAARCAGASSALSAAAASLAHLGQELSPAAKATSPKKAFRCAAPSAKKADDDSTDTGETDSEVAGDHTSDSETEDPARQRCVYSKALLLKCRPGGQPAKAKPEQAKPVVAAAAAAEEEDEEDEGATAEAAPEPTVLEAAAAAEDAPAAPEPQPAPAATQPEGAPPPAFKPPPGLEAAAPAAPKPAEEKPGRLTGLLSTPTSLRPAKPSTGQKPSLLSGLLADSQSAAPTSLRPVTAKPEQKPGELNWRSEQAPSASEGSWRQPASEGSWRRPAPTKPEASWRCQTTPTEEGSRRGAAEPARSAAEEGDSLLDFVCKQLQTY